MKCFDDKIKCSVSLKDAITWISESWFEVKESTIKNCFLHSGIMNEEPSRIQINEEEIQSLKVAYKKLESKKTDEIISVDEFLTIDDEITKQNKVLSIEEVIHAVENEEASEGECEIIEPYSETQDIIPNLITINEAEECAQKIIDFFASKEYAGKKTLHIFMFFFKVSGHLCT